MIKNNHFIFYLWRDSICVWVCVWVKQNFFFLILLLNFEILVSAEKNTLCAVSVWYTRIMVVCFWCSNSNSNTNKNNDDDDEKRYRHMVYNRWNKKKLLLHTRYIGEKNKDRILPESYLSNQKKKKNQQTTKKRRSKINE